MCGCRFWKIRRVCVTKQAGNKQLTPNYILFKINGTNRQSCNTVETATYCRINQELKFLFIKKNQKTLRTAL